MRLLPALLACLAPLAPAVVADNDERGHPTISEILGAKTLQCSRLDQKGMDVLAEAIGCDLKKGYHVVAIQYVGTRLVLASLQCPKDHPLILLSGQRYIVAVDQDDQDAPLGHAAEILEPHAAVAGAADADVPSDDGHDCFWDTP